LATRDELEFGLAHALIWPPTIAIRLPTIAIRVLIICNAAQKFGLGPHLHSGSRGRRGRPRRRRSQR
jgi:hypothetical protein